VAWVAAHCSSTIPFLTFGSGRSDLTVTNPTNGMWQYSVAMVNALETCHDGFAFAWNNGDHSAAGTIGDTFVSQYQPLLAKNVSYPAFTAFSLDSNYGDGTISDGDCTNGTTSPVCYVNYGWKWNAPVESSTSWSVTVSNSQLTSGACPTQNCATTATVSITPRNTQSFKPPTGTLVNWSTTGSAVQRGSATVDEWGVVTGIAIELNTTPTTITFETAP
jgi:hypothetical protein